MIQHSTVMQRCKQVCGSLAQMACKLVNDFIRSRAFTFTHVWYSLLNS